MSRHHPILSVIVLLVLGAACDGESLPGPTGPDLPDPPDSGSLTIGITTTGESVPLGYSLTVDEGPPVQVQSNETIELDDLSAGPHTVLISNVASNCTVDGENPRIVQIDAGATASTAIDVSCTTTRGAVAVSTTTTGPDVDSDGYSLLVDGGSTHPLGTNDSRLLDELEAGSHTLELAGMAGNCELSGSNPRTVEVVAAETVSLTFELQCEEAPDHRIAFSKSSTGVSGVVFVMDAAGTNPTRLASGFGPEFSPNGTRVLVSEPASYVFDIVVMDADGSNETTLVSYGSWGYASWSPDGTRITYPGADGFSSGIMVMNADGSNPVRITDPPGWDRSPDWSPDGSRIAFSRSLDGGSDIYTVRPDGSDLRRLTDLPGSNRNPAWSPDGSRLAFTSTQDGNEEIYTMNADGSNLVRLTNDPGADVDPAWSPDGSLLAFATDRDGNFELYWMGTDGERPRRLTYSWTDDRHPAWSP